MCFCCSLTPVTLLIPVQMQLKDLCVEGEVEAGPAPSLQGSEELTCTRAPRPSCRPGCDGPQVTVLPPSSHPFPKAWEWGGGRCLLSRISACNPQSAIYLQRIELQQFIFFFSSSLYYLSSEQRPHVRGGDSALLSLLFLQDPHGEGCLLH